MSMKIDGEKGQAGYLLGLVFCVREMAGSSATGCWRGSWGLSMVRRLRARWGSWALCSLGPPACCPQAAGSQPLNG